MMIDYLKGQYATSEIQTLGSDYHVESISSDETDDIGEVITSENFEYFNKGKGTGVNLSLRSIIARLGGSNQYLKSYSERLGEENEDLIIGKGTKANYSISKLTSSSDTVGFNTSVLSRSDVNYIKRYARDLSNGDSEFSSIDDRLSRKALFNKFGNGLVDKHDFEEAGNMLPLKLYKIQNDTNPKVITRSLKLPAVLNHYRQNIKIRFLKPPTPPTPGPLIIKEVWSRQQRPAPPVIIKQRALRQNTPPPIILRERPPAIPMCQKTKVVVRKLASLPPPERQVIVERYHALPPKQQTIIIERWIPYANMPKRQIIIEKAIPSVNYKPKKNVIIEYTPSPPKRERVVKYLGVVSANPITYIAQYGASLLDSHTIISTARRLGVFENISPPTCVHGSSFFIKGDTSTKGLSLEDRSSIIHNKIVDDESAYSLELHGLTFSERKIKNGSRSFGDVRYGRKFGSKVHFSYMSGGEYETGEYSKAYGSSSYGLLSELQSL
ncbi:hypothetical protein GJ496_004919 [Pomphorhynchus laevis]|nr:hypothetical protein GJ496_004919 [Pomphorhynchus laevis]